MTFSPKIAATALLTVGLLATSSVVFAKPSSTPVPVTECGQILNVKGQEYILTGNLSCGNLCPDAAITISASNVHLNMAGFSVSAICAAAGISDGVSKVTIDGGGGLDGGAGLTIGKDHHVTVTGVSISGDPDLGGDETGVTINGATNVSVTGNTIGGVFGISGTVNHGVFSGNTVNADSLGMRGGIVLTGSGNLIEDNTVTDLTDGAAGSSIGVGVTKGNRVLNNTVNQFFVGINLAGNSNTVSGNTVNGATAGAEVPSEFGIDADTGAKHNKIEDNTVMGNTSDMNDSNGPPCVNTWKKNVFQTSSGAVACIH